MSRIIFKLFLFLGFLFIYPQIFGDIKAADVTVTPSLFSNQDTSGVDIKITGLLPSKKYMAEIQKNNQSPTQLVFNDNWWDIWSDKRVFSPDSKGNFSFHLCSEKTEGVFSQYKVTKDCQRKAFAAATYSVSIKEYLRNQFPVVATSQFTVYSQTTGDIEFENTSFITGGDIKINIKGLSDGSYKIEVDGKDPTSGANCVNSSKGNLKINLGQYYEGEHRIQVYTNTTDNFHPLCGKGALVAYRCFNIDNKTGGGSCPGVGVGTTSPATANKCNPKSPSYDPKKAAKECTSAGGIPCGNDPKNPGFVTAIGCIHTSPAGFVKDFLKFIIGISGGLAFLMMILGAFQMLTSAGNPETLQAGRDRLQSAIIGLLFVIFAVLLMQIIGVGILNIPGFKP